MRLHTLDQVVIGSIKKGRNHRENAIHRTDIADGNGTASIYNVFIMDNGDEFFARSAAVIQSSSGKLTATAVGHITGGTGKVAAIQGTFRSVTNFDPKSSFNETAGEIEYSIGK